MRRFARRMDTLGIRSYREYGEHLADHDEEFGELFNTILINVTAFFRDPGSWEYLAEAIIPRILESKRPDATIRVWSTGCATGEEAYTVAVLFAEALHGDVGDRLKVYATDVDDEALGAARHATYPAKAMATVPERLRETYFERTDSRYIVRPDVRRSVIFGRHNVLEDPPISRVDLITARNTLMYFAPEKQAGILADFHFALNESGFLLLGKSELLLTRSNLFVPVDLRRRVFAPVPRRGPAGFALRERPAPPTAPERERTDGPITGAGFESAPLAQILVNDEGKMAVANLQARRLFDLSHHEIGQRFSDLELSYRPTELRSHIDAARGERRTVHLRDVEWRPRDGEVRYLDIQIAPIIPAGDDPTGTIIAFTDVTRYRELHNQLERANEQLETAYDELQAASEELETTNEELQSTNEELETTNEELQSTNEELETMNEELQSTNEEMETMNDELRLRTDDLARVNSFLESILSSVHLGVVVLDRELTVQAWNRVALELWGLSAEQAVGTHFLNLDIALPVDEILASLRACLETGERQELTLSTRDRRGREVQCRVTCTLLENQLGDGTGVLVLMEAVRADEG